jgi:hypothetical protein
MSQDLVGDGDITITQAQNRAFALADGFQRMTSNRRSNTWPLFLRYKVLTEREYRRTLEDFDRLKALRHELPNEPIIDDQPEPIETTCGPSPADPIPPHEPLLTPPPEPLGPQSQEPGPAPRISNSPRLHHAPVDSHRPIPTPQHPWRLGYTGRATPVFWEN